MGCTGASVCTHGLEAPSSTEAGFPPLVGDTGTSPAPIALGSFSLISLNAWDGAMFLTGPPMYWLR